ncbi:hypothetical protein WA158_003899 [Blastocystis sp. Blastoise]
MTFGKEYSKKKQHKEDMQQRRSQSSQQEIDVSQVSTTTEESAESVNIDKQRDNKKSEDLESQDNAAQSPTGSEAKRNNSNIATIASVMDSMILSISQSSTQENSHAIEKQISKTTDDLMATNKDATNKVENVGIEKKKADQNKLLSSSKESIDESSLILPLPLSKMKHYKPISLPDLSPVRECNKNNSVSKKISDLNKPSKDIGIKSKSNNNDLLNNKKCTNSTVSDKNIQENKELLGNNKPSNTPSSIKNKNSIVEAPKINNISSLNNIQKSNTNMVSSQILNSSQRIHDKSCNNRYKEDKTPSGIDSNERNKEKINSDKDYLVHSKFIDIDQSDCDEYPVLHSFSSAPPLESSKQIGINNDDKNYNPIEFKKILSLSDYVSFKQKEKKEATDVTNTTTNNSKDIYNSSNITSASDNKLNENSAKDGSAEKKNKKHKKAKKHKYGNISNQNCNTNLNTKNFSKYGVSISNKGYKNATNRIEFDRSTMLSVSGMHYSKEILNDLIPQTLEVLSKVFGFTNSDSLNENNHGNVTNEIILRNQSSLFSFRSNDDSTLESKIDNNKTIKRTARNDMKAKLLKTFLENSDSDSEKNKNKKISINDTEKHVLSTQLFPDLMSNKEILQRSLTHYEPSLTNRDSNEYNNNRNDKKYFIVSNLNKTDDNECICSDYQSVIENNDDTEFNKNVTDNFEFQINNGIHDLIDDDFHDEKNVEDLNQDKETINSNNSQNNTFPTYNNIIDSNDLNLTVHLEDINITNSSIIENSEKSSSESITNDETLALYNNMDIIDMNNSISRNLNDITTSNINDHSEVTINDENMIEINDVENGIIIVPNSVNNLIELDNNNINEENVANSINLQSEQNDDYIINNHDISDQLTNDENNQNLSRNSYQIIDEEENKYEYYDLGKMIFKCSCCNALHFEHERNNFKFSTNYDTTFFEEPSNSYNDTINNTIIYTKRRRQWTLDTEGNIILKNSQYSGCCRNGKVRLGSLSEPDISIQNLLNDNTDSSKQFKKDIRRYNNSIAFASMSCTDTQTRLDNNGIYFYKVHGNIYHSMADLYPPEGITPNYNQIYIYDQEEAFQLRSNNQYYDNLNTEIMRVLHNSLLNNELMNAFKTLHEEVTTATTNNNNLHISQVDVSLKFKTLHSDDQRRYNTPSASHEIALIVPINSMETFPHTEFRCYPRIHLNNNTNHMNMNEEIRQHFTRMKYDNPFCDPMVYPIFYPTGIPLFILASKSELRRNPNYIPRRNNNIEIHSQINSNTIENTNIQVEQIERESNRNSRYNNRNQLLDNEEDEIDNEDRESSRQTHDDFSKSITLLANYQQFNNEGYPIDLIGNPVYEKSSFTLKDFYSFLCFPRSFPNKNYFLSGGKLFLQYIVDAYSKIEEQRLSFIEMNQSKLRAESYNVLRQYNQRRREQVIDEEVTNGIGKPIILNSGFVGGPRYMKGAYLDAMTIVRYYGKPDYFITFTCNPKWKEIVENLYPNQEAWERPDLVCRVFAIKLKYLYHLLKDENVFGKAQAITYTVEFQKRGLPHAHILLNVEQQDKIHDTNELDSIICAYLPDEEKDPRLFKIVSTMNIHGPHVSNSPCLDSHGICKKGFPKPFQECTTIPNDSYPLYFRPNDGRKVVFHRTNGDLEATNEYVVPYNPYLSLKLEAHINVEAVYSLHTVKYLYKYTTKGHDSMRAELSASSNETNNNEVKQYLDARYISSTEAVWRILGFPIVQSNIAVQILLIHDENDKNIVYTDGSEEQAEEIQGNKLSMLEAYFKANNDLNNHLYVPTLEEPEFMTYDMFPQYYTWCKGEHIWKPRQKNSKTLGRIPYINPTNKEAFCLKLLLTHVNRPTSFESLRMYDRELPYPTYEGVCIARGLLDDTNEYRHILDEVMHDCHPSQLRLVFALLFVYYNITDKAMDLWNEFKYEMISDIYYQYTIDHFTINERINHSLSTDPDIIDQDPIVINYCYPRALYNIKTLIESNGGKYTNMPTIQYTSHFNPNSGVSTLEFYDFDVAHREAERNYQILNREQKEIFDRIMVSVNNTQPHNNNMFFIDGPGGTGKTFLYNTLIKMIRTREKPVSAVAFTGIAATLLSGGSTSHSVFGLPLDLNEMSISHITRSSAKANDLRKAAIIIWDEAPMASIYALEVLDNLLHDLFSSIDSEDPCLQYPFVGKTIVLGGDFRQCLPVVKNGNESSTVGVCLKRFKYWNNFIQCHLVQNMRADRDALDFKEWLMKVGNGERLNNESDLNDNIVEIPSQCISTENLYKEIWENILHNRNILSEQHRKDLSENCILCCTNEDTFDINEKVLDLIPSSESEKIYYSFDTLEDEIVNDSERAAYSPEFLNTLLPQGFPPHKLRLRKGCIIMLLRNLNIKKGLCNGTRLVVLETLNNVIRAQLLNKPDNLLPGEDIVFIPRISLITSDDSLPTKMRRKQFPVRLAFAMTINKSQGQTFKNVGLYLKRPVFSHGQLYVAFSRVRSFNGLHIYAENCNNNNQGHLSKDYPNKVFTTNCIFDGVLN